MAITDGSGAAKRRRDRRLRIHRRHEQLTLQMVTGYSAASLVRRPYGDKSTATRTGEWSDMNCTAKTRDPLQPLRGRAGGRRPGSVTDPVPQERVERHLVEHRVEACSFVQILDAPVPQGGNQLVEAFRHLDLLVPEQVIEVPKISSRVPSVQTAEQLVEVPTMASYASLHGLVEQKVHIPVPHGRHGRGGGGGLRGLHPEQNAAAFCGAEDVDIPVLHGRAGGGRSSRFQPKTEFSCFIRAVSWCCG